MEDETIVEETTTSPSEEEQTTVEGTVPQAVEEVKQIPYDRFKEVIDERNKYKELLMTTQPSTPVVPTPIHSPYEDSENVMDNVKPLIDQTVKKEIDQLNRKMELDRTISQNPDFFKYADDIKAKINENPYLDWTDAYKLAKFDSAQYEAREQGKVEAIQNIQQKRKASVEVASKAKVSRPSGGVDEINPLAKGPDGKFLFSTKELEDILPRK